MAFDGRTYRTPGLTPILSHYPDSAYTARAWSNALRSAYYVNRFASRVVMAQTYGRNQLDFTSMYEDAVLFGTGYHPISEGDFYAHDEVTHISVHVVFIANALEDARVKHRVTISDGVSADVSEDIQTTYHVEEQHELPETLHGLAWNQIASGRFSVGEFVESERASTLFARTSVDVSSLTADRDWRVLVEVQSGEAGNEYLYWPVFSLAFWEVRET